jgi:hypothetical protein
VLTIADGIVTSLSYKLYDASFNEIAVEADNSWTVTVYDKTIDPRWNAGTTHSASIDTRRWKLSIYEVSSLLITANIRQQNGFLTNYFGTYIGSVRTDNSPNIFEAKNHDNAWIASEGPVKDSFGWVNDLFFPWIYSASQDILSNGSYLGNGNGWMYVQNGGTLSGGFYFYRYATGSWCWTRWNWSGWIFDYTNGWVDITP